MRKTFKYRLLGNKTTFANAERWLDLCRNLYNAALEERITAYKTHKVSISCYNQMKELPELKVVIPEYKNIDAQTLQDVLERLDRAYKAFFRRLKNKEKAGFPRFKGKDRYDSFILKQHGWKIDRKYLTIRNIGRFKMRLSRPLVGIVKTVGIHQESTGKWYVCFSCDNVPERKLPESNETIGIDVGIKSFCVDSEDRNTDNPQYLKESLRDLRIKQRRLSRRKKGGMSRGKARLQVAKAHEGVKNRRNDFLHKLANHYVRNYGVIAVEELNIKGMERNHRLARSIDDAGWGIFVRLLTYKAVEAGRQIVRIPQFTPTSKMCSECSAINQELKLSDRQWVCQSCGTLHDRDYNAAKNIKRVGQTQQALTCEVAQSVACESPKNGKGDCQDEREYADTDMEILND